MSFLYNTFLNYCLMSYSPCSPTDGSCLCDNDSLCEGQYRVVNNCINCLSNMFNDPDQKLRRYNCLPITHGIL